MTAEDSPVVTIERGPLTIRSSRQDDWHVVALCGELDIGGVEAVQEETGRVEQTPVGRIVVDLSALESWTQAACARSSRSPLARGRTPTASSFCAADPPSSACSRSLTQTVDCPSSTEINGLDAMFDRLAGASGRGA